MSTYLWPSLLHNVNIYIYIYILLFFLHICPLLIPLNNTTVLIKICRFWINVVKFTQTLTKLDLPTLRKCQIFYLLRCFLSSMLPKRSVGRSNFVRVCVNLTTLIQKRHILMRTAVLYIYSYICLWIWIYFLALAYVTTCDYADMHVCGHMYDLLDGWRNIDLCVYMSIYVYVCVAHVSMYMCM